MSRIRISFAYPWELGGDVPYGYEVLTDDEGLILTDDEGRWLLGSYYG